MTENEVQNQDSMQNDQNQEVDEVVSFGSGRPSQETSEAESNEVESSSTEDVSQEPDTQQQSTDQSSQQAKETTADEIESDPQFTWNDVFKTVKERTGIQFNDVDNLVKEVSEYQKLKDNPYSDLPNEVQAHIDFLNSGGDTSEYYRLKSMDFEKMSDREILFQNYLRENPEMAANMDFARIDFNRSYSQNYSILNNPEKRPEDFRNDEDEIDHKAYDQYKQDYDYLSQKIKIEGNVARKKLIDWQQKATSPKIDQSTGLTEEQASSYLEEHNRQVSEIKQKYKGESFQFSDKTEDKMNLGLSESVRSVWEKDLDNPMNLFSEMGLMPDGRLDLEKFKSAAFKMRIWPQLGPIVQKFVLEQNNRQTVLGKQVNPNNNHNNTEPRNTGDDEEAEAAQLFYEQLRGR